MQSDNTMKAPSRSILELYTEMLTAQAREYPEETSQSREIFVCSWLLKHAFEYMPEDYMHKIGDRQLWAEDIVGGAVLVMYQHFLEVKEQNKVAQQLHAGESRHSNGDPIVEGANAHERDKITDLVLLDQHAETADISSAVIGTTSQSSAHGSVDVPSVSLHTYSTIDDSLCNSICSTRGPPADPVPVNTSTPEEHEGCRGSLLESYNGLYKAAADLVHWRHADTNALGLYYANALVQGY